MKDNTNTPKMGNYDITIHIDLSDFELGSDESDS